MNQASDEIPECKLKLQETMDVLALSSDHFREVIFSSSDTAVDLAFLDLRLAMVRFLAARAECQEICQPKSLVAGK